MTIIKRATKIASNIGKNIEHTGKAVVDKGKKMTRTLKKSAVKTIKTAEQNMHKGAKKLEKQLEK